MQDRGGFFLAENVPGLKINRLKSSGCIKCLHHPEGNVALKLSETLCVSQMFTAASFYCCEGFKTLYSEYFHSPYHRVWSCLLKAAVACALGNKHVL